MSVETTFETGVLADSAVAALIGTRLYRTQIPQNPTFPCADYTRISTTRIFAQQQAVSTWGAAGWTRFQVCAWDKSGEVCNQIADAVRGALKTFGCDGAVGSAPNLVVSEAEEVMPGTKPPIYRRRFDVMIFFRD